MPISLKNLAYIRQANQWTPDLGAKLAEDLISLVTGTNNIEQQTASNATGQPQPPGQVNGLNVTAQNGHFSAEITDQNQVYRGVQYFIEHADNPHFENPIVEQLGTTRNWTKYMGNVTRYFRAYSSYPSSEPSTAVYHGSSVQPLAVQGGSADAGGPAATSQGSGTGAPGEGLQGPGGVPYRTSTGAPPPR